MTFGTTLDDKSVASLLTGATRSANGAAKAPDAAARAAFDMQMRMAQNLFGEGSGPYGEGSSSGGFDAHLVNDSMMFEALTTITRLMQNEAGLPVRQQIRKPAEQTVQDKALALANELAGPDVGSLSARFESGSAGVAAIGYDRVGGTSYGKYQIASKPGTMDRFLSFLDDKAPAWADRLRNAGPTDTGSKEGGMPDAWKAIAAENSDRFEQLQHDFIAGETYDPARAMILKQTGLDFDNAPPVLREVLWSTSVQHGPTGAARIFNKVIDRFVGNGTDGDFNAKLIEGVYDTRKGQFGSSTQRVQESVANRLNQEKQLALSMLATPQLNRIV